MMTEAMERKWKAELKRELTENILPFWMTHAVNARNGGMHGAVTNDLQVKHSVPRSAILSSRVLWTFSAAFRQLGDPQYRTMAERAYNDLAQAFWDEEHGGVVWLVDRQGEWVSDRKHHYAQAFAIYGLSEYFRATGSDEALQMAKRAFELLERHGFDAKHGGYFEGSSRKWGALTDPRLSDKDLASQKSMNTMLHLLEAYTNLLRVWDNDVLKRQLAGMLRVFCTHIVDFETGHMKLFFDDAWNELGGGVSFGHDIEASWLLHEAADELGDPEIMGAVLPVAMKLAEAVLHEGVAEDGSLFTEASSNGVLDRGKDWWPQAEAIVGFYNAFQLTGHPAYERAAFECWGFVKSSMVDAEHGDWVKRIDEAGEVDPDRYKSGPWECPYHHSRTCLEMIERLPKTGGDTP